MNGPLTPRHVEGLQDPTEGQLTKESQAAGARDGDDNVGHKRNGVGFELGGGWAEEEMLKGLLVPLIYISI